MACCCKSSRAGGCGHGTRGELERAVEAFGVTRQMEGNQDDRTESRDSFTEKFMTHLRNRRSIPRETCTIYRVPPEILAVDKQAYLPTVVGLGPYLHDRIKSSNELKQLQEYKWRCVDKLVSRTSSLIRKCLQRMKDQEQRVRDSYSRDINMNSEQLAKKMVLDGCFILHLLLKHADHAPDGDAGAGGQVQDDDDDDWTQVIGRCWIWNLVKYDLLLLENQIPFFVIVDLHELLRTEPPLPAEKLISSGLQLFSALYPLTTPGSFTVSVDQVHHLLHLVYLSIIPQNLPAANSPVPQESVHNVLPSAKELMESGVKFRKKTNAQSFLDITFTGGVLEIPELRIYNYSNSLFRNLIAFEQCYPGTRSHVTASAAFMDLLVRTVDGARLLHLKGILVNGTAKEEHVNRFFSQISSGAHYTADRNYLGSLIEDVVAYHGKRRNRWRAALERNYCTNPWVIISVLAACVLLLLAVTNTVVALLSRLKH
ncbi:UPF0481 protein At3g47200-like [Miscanthus floridulus]|uniref:UPF0481 protein At3g47200-like n=1 Tax=Miscanthus floridulus TaxID=154761 RepID=UPI00345AAA73